MKDSTFGGLAFLAILAVVILIAVLMNKSHASSWDSSHYDRLDSLACMAQQDSVKWAEFLECSKDEGDAGCDSCFTAIYGYSLEER
jgi:hypothetical protein